MDVLSEATAARANWPLAFTPDGSAEEFGDEPLLIARETGVPVYVALRRYDAGVLAEAEALAGGGQGIHLLDDGFQHRQLARDVDILLLNQNDWQDGLLPAGNLREPLEAIRRADVLAIPANEPELEAALHVWGWTGAVWLLHRTMEIPAVRGPVAAFCGIARPEQFFAGLEAASLEIALKLRLPRPLHLHPSRSGRADLPRRAKKNFRRSSPLKKTWSGWEILFRSSPNPCR